jgi:hypothetical protein
MNDCGGEPGREPGSRENLRSREPDGSQAERPADAQLEKRLDTQQIELLGRQELISQLVRAGVEVATPLRDRGVDLIAYCDLSEQGTRFAACPIQLKVASGAYFSVERKYARIADLLIVYLWNLEDPKNLAVYAMTYAQALAVAEKKGWTKTSSWMDRGCYTVTSVGRELERLLRAHRMSPSGWRALVRGRAEAAVARGQISGQPADTQGSEP